MNVIDIKSIDGIADDLNDLIGPGRAEMVAAHDLLDCLRGTPEALRHNDVSMAVDFLTVAKAQVADRVGVASAAEIESIIQRLREEIGE